MYDVASQTVSTAVEEAVHAEPEMHEEMVSIGITSPEIQEVMVSTGTTQPGIPEENLSTGITEKKGKKREIA